MLPRSVSTPVTAPACSADAGDLVAFEDRDAPLLRPPELSIDSDHGAGRTVMLVVEPTQYSR